MLNDKQAVEEMTSDDATVILAALKAAKCVVDAVNDGGTGYFVFNDRMKSLLTIDKIDRVMNKMTR